MKRWFLTLAATAAIVTLRGQPQPPPPDAEGPRRPGLMGNADTNGDGKVDEVEAQQAAKQRLAALKARLDQARQQFDTDGDGQLNAQEQAALKNRMAERGRGGPALEGIIAMVDKDGDWQLNPEEEAAALQALVQRIQQGEDGRGDPMRGAPPPDPDANGDCIIDDTEARLAAEKRVDLGRKLIDRLRERNAGNPNAPYPPMAAELDTDRNLDVSDAEAQAGVARVMAELQKRNAVVLKYFDTDKDGTLGAAELPVAKTAFAFMNEVRPERPEFADRMGEMMRERFRDRGPEGRGEGRRASGRNGERPPPPPPPAGAPQPPPPAQPAAPAQ
jgi:hypothetical protein